MRGNPLSTAPKGSEWLANVVGQLTALGSTQGTAYAIPPGQDCSVFGTVAAGTGAMLPGAGVGLGEDYEVVNHGANALLVYPVVGGQIGTLGANAGYSVAAGKMAFFRYVGPKQWTCCP